MKRLTDARRALLVGSLPALMLASLPVFLPRAIGAEAQNPARLARAAYRCTKLVELISCYVALSKSPNDPNLLVAEADALVQLKRPGEAIGVYRNALTVAAHEDVVNPKIAVAQSLRRSLLETCMTGEGAVAERACAAAWLPGAPDEVSVFKRRGLLLAGANQPAAALDAYLAAARLSPKDHSVANEIVSLSGSTGARDAPTLTAVGTALITLGRPAEAAAALRRALQVAPDLVTAKERLRTAERAVAANAARAAAVRAKTATAPGSAADTPPATDSNDAEVTRSN